jgi:hypothetical protein
MDLEYKCKDELKAYLGLPPYEEHISKDSGVFYQLLLYKYGRKMVEKCEKELKDDTNHI